MISLLDLMKVEFAGKERETLLDPLYKRIDKNGRIYLDINKAGEEILVLAIKPIPEDKINYIKVGRS
jgi:hypothetical protein